MVKELEREEQIKHHTIERIREDDESCKEVVAIDSLGKRIFGHDASLFKKNPIFSDGKDNVWEINWGSIGTVNTKEAEVHYNIIREAVKWAKELNTN